MATNVAGRSLQRCPPALTAPLLLLCTRHELCTALINDRFQVTDINGKCSSDSWQTGSQLTLHVTLRIPGDAHPEHAFSGTAGRVGVVRADRTDADHLLARHRDRRQRAPEDPAVIALLGRSACGTPSTGLWQ